MKVGIKIPVLYHTDSTWLQRDIGKDTPLKDHEIRVVIFYNIEAIAPYYDELDNDKEYCRIYISGDTFLTNMTCKELELYINEFFN